MNKHAQSRAIVLQATRNIPKTGKRKAQNRTIDEQDYTAVPPPLNLQVHPAGDCLIWLWKLNAGGYGTASFPDKEQLAHRHAFTRSRGHQPKRSVLHLCHRPFCIQPSHLYDGSPKENSQDRRIRTSHGLRLDLFTQKSEIVQTVARYRWPSQPRDAHKPLMVAPAEHDCEFIVPAMDRNICPTCGRDNLSDDNGTYFAGAAQPENTDPNVSHISRRSRFFRNPTDGIAIETTATSDYSIPLTRPERRRREKQARKSPLRDKPLLLGSTRVKFKQGETSHFQINMKDLPVTGPGILLLTARPIEHENETPDLIRPYTTNAAGIKPPAFQIRPAHAHAFHDTTASGALPTTGIMKTSPTNDDQPAATD